jgi:hypothetical protein
MLQPEPLHLENLTRPSPRFEAVNHKSVRQSKTLGEVQGMNLLAESLIPEGVSPAKRAVIERLITLWLNDSKLDVA